MRQPPGSPRLGLQFRHPQRGPPVAARLAEQPRLALALAHAMKPTWFNLFRHRLTLLLGGLSLSVAAALALYIGQMASARMTHERGIDLSTIQWAAH